MSAIPHTPRLGFGTRFSARRFVVVLVLVAALAAAALTVAIVSLATNDDVGSNQADAATPVRVIPSAPPERRHLGGHGDSIAVPAPNAPNDGSAHAGARP